MVDVVAGDGIEGLVGKGQFGSISFLKLRVADAFGLGVILAEGQTELRIILAPAVNAHHASLGIALGTGDGQSAAAAAHIQTDTAIGQGDIFRSSLNDFPGKLPLSIIGKGAAK